MSKFGDLGSKFSKAEVKLEISIFETGYRQAKISLRLEIWYFLAES